MNTLTDTQREQFHATLQARKAQLLAELGENQREILSAIDHGGDAKAADQKEQAEQQDRSAVRDAEARRDHDELVAVRAALARLAEGSYGACTDCGQPIALPRLQAQPEAARCIGCQSVAEQQAGRPRAHG